MATPTMNPELRLKQLAASCKTDPLRFAKAFWPDYKPRKWQAEILGYIRDRLQAPETHYKVTRVAVCSGNGIGKSALIGMLLTWAMTTCAGCRGRVTAGKAEQLETKTVPEVSKWFKNSLAAQWFDVRARSIRALDTDEIGPENWRIDFETWTEERPDTFHGLHNAKKRIIVVVDEGSAVADVIYDGIETGWTDEETEFIYLVFGNPVHNTGRFRELFGSHKHLWKTYQIDSRTVEGTNKEQAEEWIALWGEDSDFVRVKVRGEFPRAGSSQFISAEVVADCRKYKAVGYEGLPKIIAVDVAYKGDDQTVIGMRQGRKFQILGKYRGKDTVWVANETIRFIQELKPDATVVDATGIGAGVFDQITHRGFSQRLYGFHGGASPNDGAAYYNRRAEVWGLTRQWLMDGAEIPDDAELATDLTGPEYGFSSKNQIQLEKKEDMKARGLNSPDIGDCLAMTFAVKVVPKPKEPKATIYSQEMAQSWMG